MRYRRTLIVLTVVATTLLILVLLLLMWRPIHRLDELGARRSRIPVSLILQEPECAAKLVEHMGVSNVRTVPHSNHSLGASLGAAAGSDANGTRNRYSQ